MEQIFTSSSQQETEALGARLADQLAPGSAVAFFGDLGAGKTAFIRGLLRRLGYAGEVTSPTFAIVNEYRGGRLDAAHFDMYRISGPDELYGTGFYDYLDGRMLVLIEWSENIESVLEDDWVRVRIEGCADEVRTITVTGAKPL